MINKPYFFLKYHLRKKPSHITSKNSGFTLIELLVAMILAVLVITPLLGFMVNILNTDRKEQAKVNSEQEIQTALDYIAQDLKQAIYIYDAKGIKAIQDQLPYASDADKVPVLVFWKREFKKGAISGSFTGTNDGFVYSLAAYYLIQSNSTNNANKIWSNQFRIAKFELNGGIKDPDEPFLLDSQGRFVEDANDKPIPKYITDPDPGFALFEIDNPAITGTVENKMNSWEKGSEDYQLNNTAVLVDYIDASPKNASAYPELEPIDCTIVFDLDRIPDAETALKASKTAAQRVPSFSGTHSYSTNGDLNNGSFYACVDVDRISAKVFIRGNSYARINNGDTNYNQNRKSYFPTASSQVKARGILGAFKE